MEIVHYPHPALRWKSKPLTVIDSDLPAVVRTMFDLMYANNGIGLAANQVALPWRLFVLNLSGDATEKDEEYVFINPEIVQRRGSDEAEEGCLSMPKLFGPVRRAAEVVIEAFDLDGVGFEMRLDELAARAVQHETDHLDGILFTDRMNETQQREVAPVLGDFTTQFRRAQEMGKYPSDEALLARLKELEPK